MGKLRLKLGTLDVESFVIAPAAVAVAAGTVQGHQLTLGLQCAPTTTCYTEYYSCAVEQTYLDSCKLACDCTRLGSPC